MPAAMDQFIGLAGKVGMTPTEAVNAYNTSLITFGMLGAGVALAVGWYGAFAIIKHIISPVIVAVLKLLQRSLAVVLHYTLYAVLFLAVFAGLVFGTFTYVRGSMPDMHGLDPLEAFYRIARKFSV